MRWATGVKWRRSVTRLRPSFHRPQRGPRAEPMTVLPALPHDAREEPHPQFMIERGELVTAQRGQDAVAHARQCPAIEVARHAEDVRHKGAIERRALRRLHVEAPLL